MIEGRKQIGFTLEILDDCLAHQRVGRHINHLFDRHQFHNAGKMQIAGPIHRPHPADANHILNQVTVDKRRSRLQLLFTGALIGLK